MRMTATEYSGLDEAYQHLNAALFDSALPDCLIVLNRKSNAKGYFAAERFENRNLSIKTDEIALNPDAFDGRTDLEILSTLAHEQCHLWQFHFGNAGTKSYHDSEWANKMESIGLMPSSTGAPGGKRTGRKITHYILSGGAFEKAATQFLHSGVKINWQSPSERTQKKAPVSKLKFTCPSCQQHAWAKPTAVLMCGACKVLMS